MKNFKHVFGPVPSRRMGISIGISPIPKKYCNYSCVYCQLGRTHDMTNKREEYFKVENILKEFSDYLKEKIDFDVVTVVGEGEPTLYACLGELVSGMQKLTDKPVAVITNGSLLNDPEVREQLMHADIVLPSFDGCDQDTFKKMNRSHGEIIFKDVYEGLQKFSHEYKGQLWIEIMLVKDINDDEKSLEKFKELLKEIDYDRLYLNAPVRPPAEKWVEQPSEESMARAIKVLEGVSIDSLASEGFKSEIEDDYEAILSIIARHPMNQHELRSFLVSRECEDVENIFTRLSKDDEVEIVDYKGYKTFRSV